MVYLNEVHEVLVLQSYSWDQTRMYNYAAMTWNRDGEGQVVHEGNVFTADMAKPLPFVLHEGMTVKLDEKGQQSSKVMQKASCLQKIPGNKLAVSPVWT